MQKYYLNLRNLNLYYKYHILNKKILSIYLAILEIPKTEK